MSALKRDYGFQGSLFLRGLLNQSLKLILIMKKTIADGDEQLVSLYRGGNISAFNTLLIRYIPKIRRVIQRFLSDTEEINDVLQDI